MTATLLQSLQDNLARDVRAFLPELIVCAGIVLLLLLRLVSLLDRFNLVRVAFAITMIALWASWESWQHPASLFDPRVDERALDLFSGLLVFDNFAIFLKLFLYGFTALVLLLALLTGIPDREDSADFGTLLLGSVVGMSVMASAQHLLMVFIGVEMASLPSYALAGFLKGRRQSSEAALKYVVYGGGAAGVMLYGISLVAGKYGSGYLPDLVRFIAAGPFDATLILGLLFILIGVAFKLAAFPFHFWCPDVFEGAAAEVAAFLSVASKGAALALLARIVYGLGGLTLAQGADLSGLTPWLVPIVSAFAIATTTFGNLAAYGQTNLKRLLAYSTIAHAGFMMMGLATLTPEGAGAVLFYLVVYLFMNLGAFAVVAILRNQTGHEDLRYFRGLIGRSPVLVTTLGVFLLSLLGLPPLGGFSAKFEIFAALFHAAQRYAALGDRTSSITLYAVLVAGGLNSVLALFYYVKVLKVMILDRSLEEIEGRPATGLRVTLSQSGFLSLLALVVLGLGIFWNPLAESTRTQGVDDFRLPAAPAAQAAQVVAGQGAP